jgi:hypothetical protein
MVYFHGSEIGQALLRNDLNEIINYRIMNRTMLKAILFDFGGTWIATVSLEGAILPFIATRN